VELPSLLVAGDVTTQVFQCLSLWLLLSAHAHNGFGDMGIVCMTIEMDVDHFICVEHPYSLHKTSRQPMGISSKATSDQGRYLEEVTIFSLLSQFPKFVTLDKGNLGQCNPSV
jgi:hypothetical protein